ncbi:MAG: hypothetical protein ACXVHU_08535 [Methanobacterium sp.]
MVNFHNNCYYNTNHDQYQKDTYAPIYEGIVEIEWKYDVDEVCGD